MTISERQILLGISIMELSGFWIRPILISNIDLYKIYPHILLVDITSCMSKGEEKNVLLFSLEFCKGPLVSVRNINSNFFTEFTDCLWTNGLENTLGLKTIQGQIGKMIEFSFGIGSLLLKEAEVRGQFEF